MIKSTKDNNPSFYNPSFIEKSVKLLRISGNESIKTLEFEFYDCNIFPGQFFMLRYKKFQKPISVSGYKDGVISFTIQDRGCGSKEMINSIENDYFGLTGPLGNSFDLTNQESILILGGGIGIAPMLFLLEYLKNHHPKVNYRAVFGSRNRTLIDYAIHDDNKIDYFTDDGSYGVKGFITESSLLKESYSKVYMCGPEKMMIAAYSIIREKNENIDISMERYMKCGIGICGSCVIDDLGERVCTEGPVFDIKKLLSTEEFGKYHRNSGGVIERN